MLTNRLVITLGSHHPQYHRTPRRASQAVISPFPPQCLSHDSHPPLRPPQNLTEHPAAHFLLSPSEEESREDILKFPCPPQPRYPLLRQMHSIKERETRQITSCRAPLKLPDNAKNPLTQVVRSHTYPCPCFAASLLYPATFPTGSFPVMPTSTSKPQRRTPPQQPSHSRVYRQTPSLKG
jgi:hypothetical protein